jgi:ribosomal protein S18 acetylase RimI-like enzyme
MFEIKYHPDSLEYGAFTKVDAHCFPDEPIGADKFAEMVTQDFWAVFDSDEFVGFGHVVLKPAFAWIVRLGVSSGCRRQGIGKRLMETMLEHCRKHGRSHVILYVMQDNPAAVGLYHRFGFLECETTYQYVVPIRQFLESRPHAASAPTTYAGPVTAVPIDQVAPGSLPEFPEQWGDIESMQSPPDNYVLIFRTDEGNTVGFCRLSPGFPGCFPFAVDGSFVSRLPEILASLRQYLDPEKEILKLTFPDQALARECDGLGFRLNYRLFKMEKVS